MKITNLVELDKERSDPAFYADGSGSVTITKITHKGHTLFVKCEGSMKAVYKDEYLTTPRDFFNKGIKTDAQLYDLLEEREVEFNESAWFDSSNEKGKALDLMSGNIYDAIRQAEKYLINKWGE
jgi:hypothetical protein